MQTSKKQIQYLVHNMCKKGTISKRGKDKGFEHHFEVQDDKNDKP